MTWTCACGASWAGPVSEAFPDLAVREWQRHHGRLPRTEYVETIPVLSDIVTASPNSGVDLTSFAPNKQQRHRWEVR